MCCVCVCVFGGEGVDAGEDERENRSAQYICAHYILLRIIWSHLQYVYLVFCMLYLVYGCSSRVDVNSIVSRKIVKSLEHL